MKHFFLRAAAYAGLYAEIFSALCRWVSRPDPWGERKPWRTVVTKALVAAGYLPPSREEIETQKAQQRINQEHALLTFHAKQPETIRTCLKFDVALLEKAYRGKNHPQATSVAPILAIPDFVARSWKLPEDWADKKELDEDGYLKKST